MKNKAIRFFVRTASKDDRKIILFSMLCVPFRVLDQASGVYLLAAIVGCAALVEIKRMVFVIILFAAYRMFSEIALRYFDCRIQTLGFQSKMEHQIRFASKYMQMDYDVIESPKGKDLAQRAKGAMAGTDYRDKSAVERIFPQISGLVSNICGVFLYAGLIAFLNPLILAVLLVTSAVSLILQKALVLYDQRDKVRYIPLDRKLRYFVKEMQDLGSAKDIRLYNMKNWLKEVFEETLGQRMRLHTNRSHLQFLFVTIIEVVSTIFSGFVYYYLIQKVLVGAIDITQFLLYFGLITGFGAWLSGVFDTWEEIHRTLLLLEDLRVFQEQEDRPRTNITISAEEGIRLEQVSFAYQADQPVLKRIDLSIKRGEQIALVGVNGAGKTTMVKLITGLYHPTSGCIMLDGKPMTSYSKEELYQKFAVVFQDIYLLPASIEKNIALSPVSDNEKLTGVIKDAGLNEKIMDLPEHERTLVVKSVQENAIELSGGEIQKLALARALYKDSEILILDEPTAKLDPAAESDMYQRYRILTEGKTSIFISHRLSSTRFCDRIIFLEDGIIKECGTHEELMKQGGAYAHMFEVQSKYYQEAVQ